MPAIVDETTWQAAQEQLESNRQYSRRSSQRPVAAAYPLHPLRQQFLRLVVAGITVADGRVRVETVIPTDRDVKLRNVRGEPVEP